MNAEDTDKSVQVGYELMKTRSIDAMTLGVQINQLNNDDKSPLLRICKKLNNPVKVKRLKQPKNKNRASNEDIFRTFLYNLKKALEAYEASDAIIELNLGFNPQDYSTLDEQQVHEKHKVLIESLQSHQTSMLFHHLELGKLYSHVKQKYNFDNKCVELKVAARKKIHFYHLIAKYPRLMCCNMSFESIMGNKDRLLKHLVNEPDLELRLRAERKETVIKSHEMKMPCAVSEDVEVSTNDNMDFNYGWQESDDFLSSTINIKGSGSADDDDGSDADDGIISDDFIDGVDKINLNEASEYKI